MRQYNYNKIYNIAGKQRQALQIVNNQHTDISEIKFTIKF